MSNMYIKHFQRVPVIFILETYSKEVSDETCTRIFLFFFFLKSIGSSCSFSQSPQMRLILTCTKIPHNNV